MPLQINEITVQLRVGPDADIAADRDDVDASEENTAAHVDRGDVKRSQDIVDECVRRVLQVLRRRELR